MYKKYIPYIVLLAALLVSFSAAFYSVFGLAKLFSGAKTQVIIMASSLEFSKLIIASIVYRNWKVFNILHKIYLISALVILIIITSAGVYGYLSNAYQITKTKDQEITKKIEVVDLKKKFYVDKKLEYDKEKEGIISSIEQLRSSLGNNYLQSIDKKTGQIIRTTSNDTRKSYESQLNDAIKRRDYLSEQSSSLSDSIATYELKIIEVQSGSDIASELGPLKYLATLTGKSMDIIVNWFILLLIVVFDPLAIILLISSSVLFIYNSKSTIASKIEDSIPPVIEENISTEQTDLDYDFLKSDNKLAESSKKKSPELSFEQRKNMSHQDIKRYLEENLDN